MSQSTDSLFRKPSEPSEAPPSKQRKASGRDKWLARALPLTLVAGFVLTAWLLFGERLLPAREVEVTTVTTLQPSADQAAAPTVAAEAVDPWEGSMLFQASGWIEADPYPIRATALTDGVVEEVRVLEGQRVERGEVLATLIAEDAELALAAVEAALATQQAAAEGAEARVEAARARLAELRDEAERLEQAGRDAVQARQIEQARLRVLAQEAELAAREVALRESERRVDEARVRRDERQLALERTQIRSPIAGIVQRLLAAPGQKKMLRMDGMESATIAILYQDDQLQARIDVPLEHAARLAIGQPVMVRSNLLPDMQLRGRVSRILGEADIQRNTLQAKVELLEPDPRLRPEMLCRAEFLPLQSRQTGSEVAQRSQPSGVQVFIPERALITRDDDRASVWTITTDDQRLTRRDLRLGQERDGHWQVLDGLRPGERLVLNPLADLTEGQRVLPRLVSVKD